MKKSEAYKQAMLAVISCTHITTTDKLDIVKVLIEDEHLALYVESTKESE